MAMLSAAEIRQPTKSQMCRPGMPPELEMVLLRAAEGGTQAWRREAGGRAAARARGCGMEHMAFPAHRPQPPALAPAMPTVPTTLLRVPRDLRDQWRPTMTQKAMKGMMTMAARRPDSSRTTGTATNWPLPTAPMGLSMVL